MRKLDGGVRMSCRLPSFRPGGVGRVANSIPAGISHQSGEKRRPEGLPLRPFVRGGRGSLVERGAIDREVIGEQRDMMTIKARGLKSCGLTVLLSMVSFEPASGQEYSMKLDAPALVGREQTFDVVLRGTSALGLVGFVSSISFDPQALSYDAHSFAGTDFEEPELEIVTDDVAGAVVVVVVLDATPPLSPNVPAGVDLSLVVLTFRTGSCMGPTTLSFGGGVDDNILADELLLGHDVDNGLVLNGATVNVEATGFIRGNADGGPLAIGDFSAALDLADGMYMVAYLFMGGNAPPCLDAADANNDGRLNLMDAIWIFQRLLGNMIVPVFPAPFLKIGEDLEEDPLDCLVPPLSTLCESP